MENEGKNTTCRLCLKSYGCIFDDVELVTIEMLKLLGLEVSANIIGKPGICKPCSQNLQKCFNFKTVCLYTEDCINSFIDDRDSVNLNLNEIYLRKNEIEKIENVTVPKRHTICRLCLEIAESGCCISLNEKTRDILSVKAILEIYFSELNLETTKDPVICTSCHESLHCYFSFIKSCTVIECKIKQRCETEASSNEPEVKSNSVFPYGVENTLDNESNFCGIDIRKNCNENVFYDEIKLETETVLQKESPELYVIREVNEHNEVKDIKGEKLSLHSREQNRDTYAKGESLVEIENHGFNINYQESDIKMEDEHCARIQKDSLQQHMMIYKSASGVTVFSCGLCTYKGTRRSSLRRHIMLIHGNSSEVTMYSCAICGYKTKRKTDLPQHMLIHKDASEVTMYSCATCTYKTKRKSNLTVHTLTHCKNKNDLEATVYSCKVCDFKTKRKRYLKCHILIHKNPLDVTMFSCEMCSFKTKQKRYLQQHMLNHGNNLYSCETCAFETKQKRCLAQHMVIHKNSSEIPMYSCDICAYSAKRKGSLKRHKLIHKNETKKFSSTIKSRGESDQFTIEEPL